MYEELVNRLRNRANGSYEEKCEGCEYTEDFPPCVHCTIKAFNDAADAIEELQRINIAMKPKYDLVCVKCAYYAEAKHNKNGFLICPASGMEITAWDFCSYFEPTKEET